MPSSKSARRAAQPKERAGSVAMPSTEGGLAARLCSLLDEAGAGLLHIAASEGGAERLGRILTAMRPDAEIVFLPAWDCLPFERNAPSRRVMGRRIAALTALRQPPAKPRLVVTTPDALLQRIAPPESYEDATLNFAVGERLDVEGLGPALERIGYVQDDRIDEPGEFALRGQVIDVFPAGSPRPFRVEHAEGSVIAIEGYDAATQRTNAAEEGLTSLFLRPISEAVTPPSDPDEPPAPRAPDLEHRLPDLHPSLAGIFDLLPGVFATLEPGAGDRSAAFLEQVRDGFDSASRLRPGEARPLAPQRLYLDRDEYDAALASLERLDFTESADAGSDRVPVFAAEDRPTAAFTAFLSEHLESGWRVVLASGVAADAAALTRRAETSLRRKPEAAQDWRDVLAARPGTLLALPLALPTGFCDPQTRIAVIAATDLLGSRARTSEAPQEGVPHLTGEIVAFRLGDAVIHLDHGLGRLEGLESVASEAIGRAETIRLRYAGDAGLMVPIEQIDRMWRYGAMEKGVRLDRLGGAAWPKRRAKIEADIAATASTLSERVQERQERPAPKLVPPRAAYQRFVARFPFAETPDQAEAIAAIAADLASGRAMDRLVCGDVGFGKTEIALRAAAACALAGKQVALVAPTTVLVRQHLQTVTRRFADLGIAVAGLSRLVGAAEARDVKKRLASGEIGIVVGTHALAGQGIAFADLGLVIIDEEQHFGVADKARLRALAADAHVLTLTATPIPRSFQSALVGLQDLSLLTTPPAERRPIRTVLTPRDDATLRDALMRENRRGGQSFVVCPRIEEIAAMAERLRALVPELDLLVAHGKMPAEAIDEAMVGFADGEGDVLLATNIIESGLDVPRANTMVVWRPDRFGLAQLHQLRGRVGRGRQRGTCYLMTDPDSAPPPETLKRLQTLESLDRLGAGFAISARDLDLRGAGDLLGENQAGHLKLIGPALYRRLLERALATAWGDAASGEDGPEIHLGLPAFIPTDFVPEPEVRLNLYADIAAAAPGQSGALADEIEDRFGALPEPVRALVAGADIRERCRQSGIARLDAGPQAIALTFRGRDRADRELARLVSGAEGELAWTNDRLIWARPTEEASRLEAVLDLLARIPALR